MHSSSVYAALPLWKDDPYFDIRSLVLLSPAPHRLPAFEPRWFFEMVKELFITKKGRKIVRTALPPFVKLFRFPITYDDIDSVILTGMTIYFSEMEKVILLIIILIINA